MRFLNLGRCNDVTDEGLKALGDKHQLRSLYVENYSMTGKGLKAAIDGKVHLRDLDVSSCRHIRYADLAEAIKDASGLRTLDMQYGADTADHGFQGVLDGHKALRVLKFENAGGLMSTGMKELLARWEAGELPDLENVTIRYHVPEQGVRRPMPRDRECNTREKVAELMAEAKQHFGPQPAGAEASEVARQVPANGRQTG